MNHNDSTLQNFKRFHKVNCLNKFIKYFCLDFLCSSWKYISHSWKCLDLSAIFNFVNAKKTWLKFTWKLSKQNKNYIYRSAPIVLFWRPRSAVRNAICWSSSFLSSFKGPGKLWKTIYITKIPVKNWRKNLSSTSLDN